MLKEKARNFKIIFNKFWTKKIFKFAFFIHFFYFIFGLILTLIFFREFNDFLVYHNVGRIFLEDIKNLYDPSNYLWPYRYFPLSALLFVPFSLMPFELAFIMFNVLNLVINFFNCLFIYKIIGIITQNENVIKKRIFYLSLYLIALPHAFNYTMGQTNPLVSLFLLSALYFFLKSNEFKWNLLGGLLVGLSLNIKPITIFVIPFLITFSITSKSKINKKELKHTFSRLLGAFIMILLNAPLLLAIPELLNGFLEINFVGTETLIVNNSFSITKLIINSLSMLNIETNLLLDLQILILIIILVLIGGTGFLIFMIRKKEKNSILYGFILGIVIMLLVYFDSWDLHLVILIPLIIISIIYIEDLPNENNQYTFIQNISKKSLYFFIFIDLPIFGLIYILKEVFPYNFIPTIFLLLLFGSVGKFLLTKETHL
ncbi:MAG: glycosyltransferase family 87 protein [Promethearchaeota archaeon]